MAQLLRIIQVNEPDRFIPNFEANLASLTEMINNDNHLKMKVELVEGTETNWKSITVLMQSREYEQTSRTESVITNQRDEIAELRKQNALLREANIAKQVEAKEVEFKIPVGATGQPIYNKPGPKPKLKEEVQA
jgi:hypothetical protein